MSSHGAPEAVAATIDLLCEFIGAKVVHEDLIRVRVRVSVSVGLGLGFGFG